MENFLSTHEFKNADELLYFFNNLDNILASQYETDLKIKKNKCENCKIEMVSDDNNASNICLQCGFGENKLVLKTWKNDEKYKKKKKITSKTSTFINFLNRYTAIATNIDPEIIEMFIKLKPKSIKDIRLILKEKNMNKLLNQDFYIWYRVSGERILITSQEKTNIIHCFKKIQDTFIRLTNVKIIEKKNLFNYEFILLKIVEILKYNHIINQMKLKKVLKSKQAITSYNIEWSKICKELNFQFIKY
jgi:hypothetical protein